MVKASKKSTAPPYPPTGPAEQFRFPLYGGEQWSAIVGTISPAKAADADLMATVHQQLEDAASSYLTLTCQHRIRFAEGSPARLMLQAHDHIKAALDYPEKTDRTPLRSILGIALEIMYETTPVEGLDMLRLSRKGRADSARDLLHHLVLKVWTDTLTGAPTVGRKLSGKREASSPAIKFLIATLKPLVEIGPEAARKIVKAERADRAALQKTHGRATRATETCKMIAE